MVEIHRKFRAFATYLQNETGFMNALTADLLWKSLYMKYEECFGKLQRKFEGETQTLRGFVKEQFVKQEQMLAEFEQERKEIQRRNEEQIRNLGQTIKELKESRNRLEESAYVMKMELETLTRYDKRREAMSDIEGAFEKLGQVMTEMDTKQSKNDKLLTKLKVLMDADRGKVRVLV